MLPSCDVNQVVSAAIATLRRRPGSYEEIEHTVRFRIHSSFYDLNMDCRVIDLAGFTADELLIGADMGTLLAERF